MVVQPVVADGEKLPLRPVSFHCVVSYGSIEHFESTGEGLAEISRVARKDGIIRISVPNARFWSQMLGLFCGTGQILEESHTLEEWSRMIMDAGMTIVSVRKDYGPPIFKNFKILGIVKRILLKLACLVPLKYNYQFVFIARRG